MNNQEPNYEKAFTEFFGTEPNCYNDSDSDLDLHARADEATAYNENRERYIGHASRLSERFCRRRSVYGGIVGLVRGQGDLNMKFEYFKNVNSIEELKLQYKTLAFKHHPDRGGKLEDMQRINAEYDELYKRVKNIHETADGKTYEKKDDTDNTDMLDKFKDIINAIINFDCVIELCGSWLWVFKAYEYRKQLKDLGFFYCSNKKAWAWTDNPSNNRFHLSLEDIRRLHGSEIIKGDEEKSTEQKLQLRGAK